MLTRLTKRLRIRAAMALAALYAVCVVAPGLTIAFASAAVAAHCLTDDHRAPAHVHAQAPAQGKLHVHADGTAHEHADASTPANDGDDQQAPDTCCGLFCFSALTADVALVARPVHTVPAFLPLQNGLHGRGPDRINRPPISLLSL